MVSMRAKPQKTKFQEVIYYASIKLFRYDLFVRLPISASGRPSSTKGSARFARTRFQGNSAKDCHSMAFLGFTVRSPATHVTLPAKAGRSPASAASKVDLPHPDSPTMARIRPAASVKLTSDKIACPFQPTARRSALSAHPIPVVPYGATTST